MNLNDLAPSSGHVRVNHPDCPAGNDTKQRLWIMRRPDGSVYAYCHHCGNRFYHRGSEWRNRHYLTRREVRETPHYQLPLGFVRDKTHWPDEAKAWINKYGIRFEEIPQWGFDVWTERVIIPVYAPDLKGWQARRIYPDDEGPKYTTKGTDLVYHLRKGTTSCVLTEDALSAHKVFRVMDACALFGVDVSTEKLLQVVNNYAKVYVWLDNDNAEVKRKQRKLLQRLTLFAPAEIIKTDKDPKCYSTQEIEEILRRMRG